MGLSMPLAHRGYNETWVARCNPSNVDRATIRTGNIDRYLYVLPTNAGLVENRSIGAIEACLNIRKIT